MKWVKYALFPLFFFLLGGVCVLILFGYYFNVEDRMFEPRGVLALQGDYDEVELSYKDTLVRTKLPYVDVLAEPGATQITVRKEGYEELRTLAIATRDFVEPTPVRLMPRFDTVVEAFPTEYELLQFFPGKGFIAVDGGSLLFFLSAEAIQGAEPTAIATMPEAWTIYSMMYDGSYVLLEAENESIVYSLQEDAFYPLTTTSGYKFFQDGSLFRYLDDTLSVFQDGAFVDLAEDIVLTSTVISKPYLGLDVFRHEGHDVYVQRDVLGRWTLSRIEEVSYTRYFDVPTGRKPILAEFIQTYPEEEVAYARYYGYPLLLTTGGSLYAFVDDEWSLVTTFLSQITTIEPGYYPDTFLVHFADSTKYCVIDALLPCFSTELPQADSLDFFDDLLIVRKDGSYEVRAANLTE